MQTVCEKRGFLFKEFYQETYGKRLEYFDSKSIHDIILQHCLRADLERRKVLVLYCHNECDEFGATVCEHWLNNAAIQILLSKPNLVITGYNITTKSSRNDLVEDLTKTMHDEPLINSIRSGESKLYIMIPYMDKIMCQAYIDNRNNVHEFQQELSRIMKLHHEILDNFKKENKLNNQTLTCVTFQQVIYNKLRNNGYDIFYKNEHEHLKNKIGYAYFGPPSTINGYLQKQNKCIEKAYKSILAQSDKDSSDKGIVEISIVFLCCVGFDIKNKNVIIHENQIRKHVPIFIIKKCYQGDNQSRNADYCRIVIDSTLRVYSSWRTFLNENIYPECVLCVPKSGEYNCDDNGAVLLEYYLSPTLSKRYKVLKGLDIAAATAAVAAGVFGVASIVCPILLPAVIIAGTYSGSYSVGRNVANLYDRNAHDEDLSFSDAESRAAYLNILAGALGVAGLNAQALINLAGDCKTIVRIVDFIRVTTGATAVAVPLYQITRNYIVDGQRPSALDLVQLAAAALFFGFSIYNARGVLKSESGFTVLDLIVYGHRILKICQMPTIKTCMTELLNIFIPSIQQKIVILVNRVIVHKAFTHGRTPVEIGGYKFKSFITSGVVSFLFDKGTAYFNINLGPFKEISLIFIQIVVQHFLCGASITEVLVSECSAYIEIKIMDGIFGF